MAKKHKSGRVALNIGTQAEDADDPFSEHSPPHKHHGHREHLSSGGQLSRGSAAPGPMANGCYEPGKREARGEEPAVAPVDVARWSLRRRAKAAPGC